MSHKLFPIAAVLAVLAFPTAAKVHSTTVVSAETTYAQHVYTVHWSLTQPGVPVDVYVAPTPSGEPSTMKKVAAADAAGQAVASDPLGEGVRPYFYVLPQGARKGLWTATRVVPLEGAGNFRDLGGYVTEDGRRVVWGKLFRSNTLSDLSSADYRTLDGIGVRVVCDLRTVDERRRQPTVWQGARPQFDESSKERNDMGGFARGESDPVKVRSAMIGFYRRAIDTYADEYRGLFQHLLAGETPLIVHCTGGKDRTGVGSALILAALGVPRPTLVTDYTMTHTLFVSQQAQLQGAKPDPNAALLDKLPPQVAEALAASDPPYIEAALDQAAAEYGSLDAYLEKRLGVGPAQRALLQARYLQ